MAKFVKVLLPDPKYAPMLTETYLNLDQIVRIHPVFVVKKDGENYASTPDAPDSVIYCYTLYDGNGKEYDVLAEDLDRLAILPPLGDETPSLPSD